jgi:esterase/lipase
MDDIIPFSQADLIYIKSTSTEKDMYKVTGANHNNILSIAREEYFKRIKKFISN